MTNKLYYGDNLQVLRNRKYIKDESIDLCYIDPPFNSKRNYNQIYNNIGNEDKAQAQAFIDTWTWDDEANYGLKEIKENLTGLYPWQSIELILGLEKVLKHGNLLSYLVHMTRRIVEIYRVLKDSGSFYLHCDQTASHYLKLIIDSVFCSQNGDFKNEIIWSYDKWTSPTNYQFQRNHDSIFFYSKNKSKINIIKEVTDNLKEKYKKGYSLGGGGGSRGLVIYDENNEKVKELISSGKYDPVYAKMEGKPISDVWRIPFINPVAKERLGYPTQKPESLLERIIKASSNEGDLILDAYCGCGTTVSVAQKLNRSWIGIDITYQSISLILKRIEDSFGKPTADAIILNGVPQDMESAIALAHKKDDKTRKEFEKWAVLTYSNNRAIINEKKGGDGGIDGIAYIIDIDDKRQTVTNKVVFSVKSDVKYPPSYIRDLFGVMNRDDAVIGVMITLYKADNLIKESKQYGLHKNKMLDREFSKIQVISVEEILEGARISIPTIQEVVKSAEEKTNTNQIGLF